MNTAAKKIRVEKGIYNGDCAVLLFFDYNKQLVEQLKQIPGVKWSSSLKCWRAPYTKAFFASLRLIEGITLEIIKPDSSSKITSTENEQLASVDVKIDRIKIPVAANTFKQPPNLKDDRHHQVELGNPSEKLIIDIDRWADYLRSKQYADSSIKTYKAALIVFGSWLGEGNHREVKKADIIEFMKFMVIHRKVSRSYQNQIINALKSFYKHTLSIHFSSEMIERPRKEFKLPKYLTREEVTKVFGALKYMKHRCIVSLLYACGLRNGELIRIELRDIDTSQRLLHVRQSKGNKDRSVPLPLSILKMLNDYAEAYRPEKYLFEGQIKGQPYTERSVQQFFKDAVIRSGIRNTEASPHWLRHSYATHIMEMGTNLRDLQQLLGHKSLRTTEIYTHISSTNFNRIVSPFDTLPEIKDLTSLPDQDKKDYI